MMNMTRPMFEGRDIESVATKVLDTLTNGGVAIFPTTVGYAIVGHTENAVKRIYAAKQNCFGKPCGWFGNWDLFNECIDIDERA